MANDQALESTAAELMATYDKDGNGFLEFDEACKFINEILQQFPTGRYSKKLSSEEMTK